MDDEVLLCIGQSRVVMSPEEAFKICAAINGSSRIGSRWVGGGNVEVMQPPSMDSFIAFVVPFTGHMLMTLEVNEKSLQGK
jgi:hypothetical protein